MGCHTWCYAHIPEKSRFWNAEYLEALKREADNSEEHWRSLDKKTLQGWCDQENRDNKSILRDIEETTKNGKLQDLISENFGGSQDYFDKYISEISHDITPEDMIERQVSYGTLGWKRFQEEGYTIDTVPQFIEKYWETHDFEVINPDGHYGLIMLHDHKIYRDTCHYRGPGYGEDPVFPKQFHDPFRIYNYEAEPCYSLEETLQRAAEEEVDWNLVGPSGDWLVNDLEKVHEFWETYPDGIIEFG